MDLTIKICWRSLNTHLSMFITLVFYLLVDMDRLMSITTTLGVLCSKGPYGSWWVNKQASEKLWWQHFLHFPSLNCLKREEETVSLSCLLWMVPWTCIAQQPCPAPFYTPDAFLTKIHSDFGNSRWIWDWAFPFLFFKTHFKTLVYVDCCFL